MKASLLALLLSVLLVMGAEAQEFAAPSPETAYIFNTMLFLFGGLVVMFMAAGFCMLEAGLVRSKNVAAICLKNIAIYAVAGVTVWLVGYNLLYGVVEGGFIGTAPWAAQDPSPPAKSFASSSDWFFQMVFVATAASIVSGAVAERMKIPAFLIFTVALTGFIYPIAASWDWGGGFLEKSWGFADFAGSTLVHSTGGWAALAGVILVGPRRGKYVSRRVVPMPGSSLPLATLGVFILWFGWFGFNGGSQLALGTISDAQAVSNVFVNTNMAACGGVLAAMALTQLLYRKIDLTLVLNGAIGGLISITAEPLHPAVWQALLIGAIGGVIVVFAVPMLDRLKIDDVVGAIPAHLFCGIWGTLIVPLTNKGSTLVGQLVGVVTIGAFVFGSSYVVWFAMKRLIGIRVSAEEEEAGLDKIELGLDAYPEFAPRQI